jgi:two-component system cell cycle response regulator DivK
MALTILYVEDNRMNFLLVRKILSAYDVEVIGAEDGTTALEMAREHGPGLVLMDLHLPGMDGFQVAEKLRTDEDLASVPIVAITASVLQDDREKAEQMGFDGYIEKPLDVAHLCEELERILGDRLRRKT